MDRDNIIKAYDEELQRVFTIFCMAGTDKDSAANFGQDAVARFRSAVVRLRKARDLALKVLDELEPK